jgi:VWFA-related protein
MFFMRAIFLLILAAALGAAQEQTPVFKSGTALVRIDVQVVLKNKPVADLAQTDFAVYEDGVPQPVEFFGREAEPVQVVLALDVSGSMSRILREMAAVAEQALATLKPQDRVALVLFARRSVVQEEFTADRALIARALREAPFNRELGGGTSLNAALLDTAHWLKEQPPFSGRRAIIVLTDNGGVHYQQPDEQVLRALAEVNAVVNAIVPPGARPPEPPKPGVEVNPDFTPADVFKIARETGGEVLKGDRAGDRFREMMERIRVRYTLGYKARPYPAAIYRALRVELTPEARRRYPNAEVRARAGYYAPGQG